MKSWIRRALWGAATGALIGVLIGAIPASAKHKHRSTKDTERSDTADDPVKLHKQLIDAYYGCVIGFAALDFKNVGYAPGITNTVVDYAQEHCLDLYPKKLTKEEITSLSTDVEVAISALQRIGSLKKEER